MTRRSLAAQFWYALLWCLCWVGCQVWFRYRATGRAHVPRTGAVLLVANHQSHLDPVLVGVACPRQMSALARHDLFFWPLGWLIRSLGAVPIERGRSGAAGFKATLNLLRQGEAVLVFPEGTRTRDGQLQPFHPGFCALARRSGATIIPVSIDGAFAALPRGSGFPRPKPISIVLGRPITDGQGTQLGDEQLRDLVFERIREGQIAGPNAD
jgi:1-acyl-sn-glycerol-3-phosphate acyltransferase